VALLQSCPDCLRFLKTPIIYVCEYSFLTLESADTRHKQEGRWHPTTRPRRCRSH
jgi:hypothetical protein